MLRCNAHESLGYRARDTLDGGDGSGFLEATISRIIRQKECRLFSARARSSIYFYAEKEKDVVALNSHTRT